MQLAAPQARVAPKRAFGCSNQRLDDCFVEKLGPAFPPRLLLRRGADLMAPT